MIAKHAERRASTQEHAPKADTAEVVRRGLLIQSLTGTVSAIEYLKASAVPPAVINRVLAGSDVRAEDKQVAQAGRRLAGD